MNLRSISLTLVAVLSAAGCVSVQPGPERPAPVASVRSGNVPAAQASTEPSAPAAVHDALGKAEERPRGAEERKRKPEGKVRPPAGQPEVIAPPARRQAGNRPRHHAPYRPEPRRAHPPSVARPAQPHDMRTVCATGRGIASADIVDLCRATYGR
ncbi:hypothetical protein ACFQ6U_29505 [Streptomyces sp. NPDC056465]|uniref:hypothetical protein n=1 Tax=unclassified Streptomyces TaxID=2593676 RepID=UPI003680047D